jgi:hypothetical protein
MMKNCKNRKRFKKYPLRLAKQRAESARIRDGRIGAASPSRLIDPLTGKGMGESSCTWVKYGAPQMLSNAEPGDRRALRAEMRPRKDIFATVFAKLGKSIFPGGLQPQHRNIRAISAS